jgi:hypothetical protein
VYEKYNRQIYLKRSQEKPFSTKDIDFKSGFYRFFDVKWVNIQQIQIICRFGTLFHYLHI